MQIRLPPPSLPPRAGMFCLAVGSHAEAAAIAARNPFHRRGIRVYTVRPWLEKILS